MTGNSKFARSKHLIYFSNVVNMQPVICLISHGENLVMGLWGRGDVTGFIVAPQLPLTYVHIFPCLITPWILIHYSHPVLFLEHTHLQGQLKATLGLCIKLCVMMLLCVPEKSSVFVKDPTDLMTNMYGDTIVTTNGKHAQLQLRPSYIISYILIFSSDLLSYVCVFLGEEACLLRLSLSSLFTGPCLESTRDYISG